MVEFLNMGGYAVFVWGSYAIALGLVSILYVKSTRELSKLESKLVKKTTRSEEVQSLPQEI
ncbi:MAG: heme exporter protein CcmD [Pelagibacteraceae bacterium]|jgi:heme exporter protein CcmD|nr:heme exporter protein CcmD [Pelagibacteraceae bacterium]